MEDDDLMSNDEAVRASVAGAQSGEGAAYRVVCEDEDACRACGFGARWLVVGPDDAALGVSFADECRARDYAGDLSRAYAQGQLHGGPARLVSALRAVAALDGKCMTSAEPSEDYRRGYKIGSCMAFEEAALIARRALLSGDGEC